MGTGKQICGWKRKLYDEVKESFFFQTYETKFFPLFSTTKDKIYDRTRKRNKIFSGLFTEESREQNIIGL